MNILALLFVCVLTPSCTDLGERITWKSGEVELVGTLVRPESPGPHPLVVFVQGSGSQKRSARSNVVHSARLAEMGVASLVYDKRGCGESGGDWREVGLKELADDLLPVLEQLALDPGIDAARIGLMGLSQGAWVSLMAAERSERVSFVIWLSGPPMTPAEQGIAIMEMQLEREGFDESAIAAAVALEKVILEVYRTDSGWDEAREAVDAARKEPWFESSQIGLQSQDSWNWRWYASFFDYDPLPVLGSLEKPLLAIYGEGDELVPAARSAGIMNKLAATAKATRTVLMLPSVGHDLAGRRAKWPEKYWSGLSDWMAAEDLFE